jgi:glutamate N-acetyltransferase/amino-acid N-acetyltransferase
MRFPVIKKKITMVALTPSVSLFANIPPIKGVRFAVAATGIKYKNRADLLCMSFDEGTSVAGCFTTSSITAPSVDLCKENTPSNNARALVVNSGNANCFTGRRGQKSLDNIVTKTSEVAGCKKQEVYTSSTGVIGEYLPDELITEMLPAAYNNLQENNWEEAAKAIMTTDTFYKVSSKLTHIAGVPVTINGIAKGSGMAAPNMATVLSYVFTDAKIDAVILDVVFRKAINKSFNSITVDSDTSTNDTALIFATGKSAEHKSVKSEKDAHLNDFATALEQLLIELAQLVVRDGEGATKFITIKVKGASGEKSAKKIALSVANSPLVKTAIAGSDPNWGRIMMAVGKSGEPVKKERMSLKIGDTLVVKDGGLNPEYDELITTKPYMQRKEIDIEIDVGFKTKKLAEATVWTCDLTKEYIRINADYRS